MDSTSSATTPPAATTVQPPPLPHDHQSHYYPQQQYVYDASYYQHYYYYYYQQQQNHGSGSGTLGLGQVQDPNAGAAQFAAGGHYSIRPSDFRFLLESYMWRARFNVMLLNDPDASDAFEDVEKQLVLLLLYSFGGGVNVSEEK